MPEYTTLNGRTIEYTEPTPAVAAFIERARAAAEDPAVSADAMLALVHGEENPILDHTLFPGRAMVTTAVIANPVYHVLSDLIGVKKIRLGLLDLDAAHARYTVDVPTAAHRLGITPAAVRAAIDTYRLSALFRNGQWWLAPASLASYEVSKRGRKPSSGPRAAGGVEVLVGGVPGASLSVNIAGGDLVDIRKTPEGTAGRFPAGWEHAVVKTTIKSGGTRVFELEPATTEETIEHAGLYVRGGFRITKKHNNSRTAAAAWRASKNQPAV